MRGSPKRDRVGLQVGGGALFEFFRCGSPLMLNTGQDTESLDKTLWERGPICTH